MAELWRLLRRLWLSLAPGRHDADLAREIAAHLALLEDDFRRRGQSADDARRSARLALGGVERTKELHRAARSLGWLTDLVADVRYAVRGFLRSPGFTAVSILTLGLGIGANTALFTLVDRVLVSALPVKAPDRLVELGCIDTNVADKVGCNASYPGFLLFREARDVLAGLFAFAPLADLNAVHDGRAELATAMIATADMHDVLGLAPAAGRLFQPGDDDRSAPVVAVLSHGYWQRRFGGDLRVVGQTIRLNTQAATIVGVTPPAFRGVTLGVVPDVTVPMGSGADAFVGRNSLANGGNLWLRMIGRRRDGVDLAQVQAALAPIYQRTADHVIASVPAAMAGAVRRYLAGVTFQVQPAAAGGASAMRRTLDRPLRILMAVVGVVLLIACANLATLVLSRTAARQRELGVRLAIGAGRGRLARQLLTESLLLSACGAVLGVGLATWGGSIVMALASGTAGLRAVDLQPDLTVLAFTFVVALLVAVLLALGSVWHLGRLDPQRALRGDVEPQAAFRLARVLVPGQVALAVVLLIGAGLLVQTFQHVLHTDLGFRRDGLVTLTLSPRLVGYDAPRIGAFVDALGARLASLPGVRSTTPSQQAPGGLGNTGLVSVPGFESAAPMQRTAGRHRVGARVVETWGLTLRRGRDFAGSDDPRRRVALVNESFARHFFGTIDVVGRSFAFAGDAAAHEIVGVVADARDRGPRSPVERVVYTRLTPGEMGTVSIALRVQGPAAAILPSIRATSAAVDPLVPVVDVQTMDARVDDALRRERLLAWLGTSFGSLALLLVGIGIYGLLAGAVAQRTREIGIRVALGGSRRRVLWHVLGQGLSLVAVGLLAGLGLGMLLTRFIGSELAGVEPNDPATMAAAAGILVVTGLVASLRPALRASRTDPMRALRAD
jgi:putative ABC transport system permease protein